MSEALLKKQTKALQRENRAKVTRKWNEKLVMAQTAQGGGALGGAVVAGLVDAKWGEGGNPAEFFGFPTNAATGVVGMIAGAVIAGPFKAPTAGALVGGVGLGNVCAAAYRFTVDNADFDDEQG